MSPGVVAVVSVACLASFLFLLVEFLFPVLFSFPLLGENQILLADNLCWWFGWFQICFFCVYMFCSQMTHFRISVSFMHIFFFYILTFFFRLQIFSLGLLPSFSTFVIISFITNFPPERFIGPRCSSSHELRHYFHSFNHGMDLLQEKKVSKVFFWFTSFIALVSLPAHGSDASLLNETIICVTCDAAIKEFQVVDSHISKKKRKNSSVE